MKGPFRLFQVRSGYWVHSGPFRFLNAPPAAGSELVLGKVPQVTEKKAVFIFSEIFFHLSVYLKDFGLSLFLQFTSSDFACIPTSKIFPEI